MGNYDINNKKGYNMPNFKVAIIPAGNGPVKLQTIEGEDGVSFETIYPLINADMIQIVEGKWNDVKENIVFDCYLYGDEEGRLNGTICFIIFFDPIKPPFDNLDFEIAHLRFASTGVLLISNS